MSRALIAVCGIALACCLAPAVFAQAASPPKPEPRWSTDSRLIALMADPETFPIMQKHIPRIVAQIEFATGIIVPLDFTLEDFLHVPEAQITRKDLDAINADLEALGPADPDGATGHD